MRSGGRGGGHQIWQGADGGHVPACPVGRPDTAGAPPCHRAGTRCAEATVVRCVRQASKQRARARPGRRCRAGTPAGDSEAKAPCPCSRQCPRPRPCLHPGPCLRPCRARAHLPCPSVCACPKPTLPERAAWPRASLVGGRVPVPTPVPCSCAPLLIVCLRVPEAHVARAGGVATRQPRWLARARSPRCPSWRHGHAPASLAGACTKPTLPSGQHGHAPASSAGRARSPRCPRGRR